ncbi:hypothetical protein SKAU_G00058220 [Synaphobranchus kaupii]|uniref:Leucine-rich repeat-containing protein 41 n=1 Tax=Synaphobranchus kaupii TaxID=118154 RepID=A0A9Q1JAH1_SYNKA|nr:hypothetical protein SKAU_G00058220 [Synaphobranchus kaupii]
MSNEQTGNVHAKVAALREICIQEVNEHMTVLEKQVWDLPASLIKDILPHLNIFYLERIEPAAKRKGVSTGMVWAALWKDLVKAWRCRSKTTISADEWRQKCLERLFHQALFGHIRLDRYYLSNLSWSSILSLTAKHVQVLSLFGSAREICKLAADELSPVLATLENNVRCIKLQDTSALFKQGHAVMLYIFHRLLDHGSVRDLVLTRSPDTRLLTWILQKDRRTQCSMPQADTQHFTPFGLGEIKKPSLSGASVSSHGTCLTPEHEISGASLIRCSSGEMGNDACLTPFKRPRLDVGQMAGAAETSTGCLPSQSFSWQPMDSECLFPPFTPSCSLNGEICPIGQIHSLVLEVFNDNISRTVSPLLPSCVCLRSLHFHSEWAIEKADVLGVVEALKQLFENPACSLTDLSIGSVSSSMPVSTLLLHLLTACPTLKSLSLEASPVFHQTKSCVTPAPQPAVDTVYSLERLSLRFPQVSENLENLMLVLRRASSLTALHLIGIHNGGHKLGTLLQSLPELNPNLKALSLDDVNLANCHSEVLSLLNNSKLEDVHFKDCRLLEKCKVKEDFLVPFVTALKGLTSLRSLTLSQNRLANGVIALAGLFSGDSPSKIQRLDISSNYILPMGLLEFGRLLQDNSPLPGLTVDLRCNPLDRDPQVTEQALLKLRPLCHLFIDNWNSRTTMADHISVM